MIVHDVVQRSQEWHALRCGRLCGSRAADMLATIAKGEAAGRRNLRAQLVLERLTGKPQERGFQSQAMQDGIDREQAALEAYEALSGRLVRAVGFVAHTSLLAGFSPDGVIGDFVGLVEAKSPIPATHLDYLLTGTVPGEYRKQAVHGLWITGAEWCDWLSFNPDFPEPGQIKLVRIERDENEIEEYERQVERFLEEVDQRLGAVRTVLNFQAVLAEAVA